jgi:hypothetical protein
VALPAANSATVGLEYPVFIDRPLGHGLSNIPKLNDAIVIKAENIKAENVDDRSASVSERADHPTQQTMP